MAAMTAAHACHGIDPRYLFRRLGVIAVEDVLLGNLYAVVLTLALIGSKASRDVAGDQKAAVWLAGLLAGGLKDRSACDLCVLVSYDRSLRPTMQEWAALPDDSLAEKALNLSLSISHRMMAAWLLAGTKRFVGLSLPKDNDRQRAPIMKVMARSEMPLALYYVADRAAMRIGDGMFVSLLPVWQCLQATEELDVLWNPLPPAPMIGPVLATAIDCHTRGGRVALKRFSELPEIARSLEAVVNPAHRLEALWAATFAAEGGKLNLRVSCELLTQVHMSAVSVELEYFGLRSLKHQCGLLQAIWANIDKLNEIRREVLGAMHPDENGAGPRRYEAPQAPDGPSDTIPPTLDDFAAPGAPSQPIPQYRRPLRDYDPARRDYWVWEAGDLTFSPTPELPAEAKEASISAALKKLERMPPGPGAGTVACPFPVVDAPYTEQELELQDEYALELLPFSVPFKSVLVSALKDEIELHIKAGTQTATIPLIVDAPEGLLIYQGLEVAIAQHLLGKPELWVKAVPAPGVAVDQPYVPIRWRWP